MVNTRLNSEKFQNFHLQASFLRENHKHDNQGEFPDFHEYSLYFMNPSLLVIGYYRNGHFQEISVNPRVDSQKSENST